MTTTGNSSPLACVDAHDLDRAFGGGARLAFPRAAVPQLDHVGQEFAGTHQAAGVRVGEELGDVARGPRLPGGDQRRPVTGGVEEGLEQVGHRRPAGLGMQVADQGRGARRPTAVLTGELSAGRAQRLPERGRSLRTIACLAQPIQPGIGQRQSRRAEQPGQRQVVGGIGQRSQGVEQVPDLRPAVEAAARHREEGDAGALQGVFVGCE